MSQNQAPATGQQRTGRLILVLAALTAVAPLSIDMYVPGFPGLARSFGTAASSVQLSLTAFLVGLAAGAAGMVVARAVLTDRFHGTPEAGRHFAALSAIVFMAPVAAPVLGGAILGIGSWRLVFTALAGSASC